MTAVRTIEVTNHQWPGGVGMQPPSAEEPYWRTAEGDRHSFATVLVGASEEERERLVEHHAEAIARLVRAAEAARREDELTAWRRLVSAASRLCAEYLGQMPDWVVQQRP